MFGALLPPFDRAIEELKALENERLSAQEEYKKYYSRLTDVVRRYLEEEAKIDALESTSEELLIKLELRKNAGTLSVTLPFTSQRADANHPADYVIIHFSVRIWRPFCAKTAGYISKRITG